MFKGVSALALQSNPDWIASTLYYRVPQKPTECVTHYVVIGSHGCIRKRSLIEIENKNAHKQDDCTLEESGR